MLFILLGIWFGIHGHATAPDPWILGTETGISSVNPFNLTGWDPFRASRLSLESLAKLDPVHHDLVPVLATHWEIDKRKKIYTVHLRPGVKFHDGSALTAEDVKFTFAAYRDDRYGGAAWRPLWEGIESVKSKDSLTLEFTVAKLEYAQLVGLMTQMPILPKSYYGQLNKSEWSSHLVGTGPYQLVSFSANQRLEFKFFKDWWGKPGQGPIVQNLVLKSVADRNLAVEMIKKGELHFYPISDLALFLELKKEQNRKLRLLALPGMGGTAIVIRLNLSDARLRSAQVRKALVMLWNRDLLNRKIFSGEMALAIDGFDQGDRDYPAGQAIEFDPTQARRLLKSEGWQDDGHGVLRKDGEPFVLPVLVDQAENERWVTLFKEDAQKAGIDVRIERLADDSQSWHRLKEKKFVAWSAAGMVDRGVSQDWRSDNYYNFFGYQNLAVDKLLFQLNEEFEPARRRELGRKLLLKLRPDIAILPGLYNPMAYFVLAPSLQVDAHQPYLPFLWKNVD